MAGGNLSAMDRHPLNLALVGCTTGMHMLVEMDNIAVACREHSRKFFFCFVVFFFFLCLVFHHCIYFTILIGSLSDVERD